MCLGICDSSMAPFGFDIIAYVKRKFPNSGLTLHNIDILSLTGVALAILGLLNIITSIPSTIPGKSLESGTVAAGWQNFLICIEMLGASVLLR